MLRQTTLRARPPSYASLLSLPSAFHLSVVRSSIRRSFLHVQGRTGGYIHTVTWATELPGAARRRPIISSLSTQTWRRSFPPLNRIADVSGIPTNLLVSIASAPCELRSFVLSSSNALLPFERNPGILANVLSRYPANGRSLRICRLMFLSWIRERHVERQFCKE